MHEQIKIQMQMKKRIALIAHDSCKKDLIAWCMENKQKLADHCLCGTGTTANLISQTTNLSVEALLSGPLGGDQQVGARVAENKLDLIIFFWDPLSAQPHDPDVKALLRIAVLYDIPVASNQSTANFILSSPLMETTYFRTIANYGNIMAERLKIIS